MTTAPEEETILLMFSGGIDSTYLLYHYLRHTDHPVHAHHVSIRYPHLQRWRAEDPASEKVVAWCKKNLRDFEYSTSRFDLDFPRVGWDIDLLLLVASKVALNLPRQRTTLALGWCTDDLQSPNARDRHERGVTAIVWRGLLQSVPGLDLNEEVATPILEQGLSKADVIAKLPDELLALSWSCRGPIFEEDTPRPCGAHSDRARRRCSGVVIELLCDHVCQLNGKSPLLVRGSRLHKSQYGN